MSVNRHVCIFVCNVFATTVSSSYSHTLSLHDAPPIYTPIAVGTVDVEIEQPDEARIVRVVEMMSVHESHADSLRRGLQHQWPRNEIVGSCGLEIGHADRFLPFGKGLGHFPVQQYGHPLHPFGQRNRSVTGGQMWEE